MIFQLQDLDKYSTGLLPPRCARCGWWQGHDDGWPQSDARAWLETADEEFGHWGKLAVGDERLLGMLGFGPARLFPRSRQLPCGPTSGDAILFTCSLVADDALESVRKSLVTAVLTDLRRHGLEKIEAFSRDDSGGDCRLFSSDFLRDCGFYPVRSKKGVRLMRLELGGVEPAPAKPRRRGVLDRIKRGAAAPAPVAFYDRVTLRKKKDTADASGANV